MLKFIAFGSGSSGNCYLLYTVNEAILIDSGVGLRILKKRFRDYGLSMNDIKAVLVTHDHADHVKSVGSLSKELNIPVYATCEVHKGIQRNYCVRYKVDVANIRYVEKERSFTVGSFCITPFDVPHDSSDNVGYRIEYNGLTFCLMTDVGHVTADIEKNISLADYLVIEANHDEDMLFNGKYPPFLKDRVAGNRGHLSNRSSAEALAKFKSNKLKHVWLCHLSQDNNHPELAKKTFEEILERSGCKLGMDLQLNVLKRNTPSEIFELV